MSGLIYIRFAFIAIVPVIYIGRFLSGFIYGVNHVTIIMHAADNSVKEIRGTILRWVAYSQLLCILLASIIFDNVRISYPDTYIKIGFIYSMVAIVILILTHLCVYNSFSHSLDKSRNEDAVRSEITKIINESNHTGRAHNILKETKLALNEDKTVGNGILANGNWRPLLLVIDARCLHALINNVPCLLILVSWTSDWKLTSLGAFTTLLFFKLIIGWIVIFLADCIGFNRFFYVGGIVWSVIVSLLLVLIFWFISRVNVVVPYTLLVIIIGYTLISLGIEAISYNQLSEAFPLAKRAWSITIVTIVETLVHIILISVYVLNFPEMYLLPIAIAILVICGCLLKLMPNTHGETLRNARNLFNPIYAGDSSHQKYELTELTSP